jgi:RNA 2',3'-cyclic 3'-phosphodiesterase
VTFRGFISADLANNSALETFMQELRTAGPSLKIVSPDQLHITLKFLGDTEEGLVLEILGLLRRACAGIGPARLRVRGTGAFPKLSRISVIWVGLEGAEPLATIADRLDSLLEPLGFRRESRRWTPHLTVARARTQRGHDRVRGILESHEDKIFGDAAVSEVRLKKSVLSPSGPIYSDVERVPLVG